MSADPRRPAVDSPMMLPPDDGDFVPYDAPRGTCPRCGSGEVVHLVIGMPASAEEWGSGPEWVRWVGCMHPGWDRECAACGLQWLVDGSIEPSAPQEGE